MCSQVLSEKGTNVLHCLTALLSLSQCMLIDCSSSSQSVHVYRLLFFLSVIACLSTALLPLSQCMLKAYHA